MIEQKSDEGVFLSMGVPKDIIEGLEFLREVSESYWENKIENQIVEIDYKIACYMLDYSEKRSPDSSPKGSPSSSETFHTGSPSPSASIPEWMGNMEEGQRTDLIATIAQAIKTKFDMTDSQVEQGIQYLYQERELFGGGGGGKESMASTKTTKTTKTTPLKKKRVTRRKKKSGKKKADMDAYKLRSSSGGATTDPSPPVN